MEKLEHSYVAGGNVIRRGHFGNGLEITQRLNTEPSYDLAISLLGADPRQLKPYVTQKLSHMCKQQHHSERANSGNRPDAHQLTST